MYTNPYEAIHSTIFASRTTLPISSTFLSLIRTLDRWKVLWDIVFPKHQEENPLMGGFTKIGVEIWWLAKKILELAHTGNVKCRYMSGLPTDELEDIHELIKTYAGE